MKKFSLLFCVLLTVAVLSPQAWAVTCTVSNTGTAFGAYNPQNVSNVNALGTITVNCTGGFIGETIPIVISLNAGVNGTFTGRKMKNASSSLLTYNLYLDPSFLLVWGDLTLGTLTLIDTYILLSTSFSMQYTVYGVLTGGQTTATPGSYLDTVVITLSYT